MSFKLGGGGDCILSSPVNGMKCVLFEHQFTSLFQIMSFKKPAF